MGRGRSTRDTVSSELLVLAPDGNILAYGMPIPEAGAAP